MAASASRTAAATAATGSVIRESTPSCTCIYIIVSLSSFSLSSHCRRSYISAPARTTAKHTAAYLSVPVWTTMSNSVQRGKLSHSSLGHGYLFKFDSVVVFFFLCLRPRHPRSTRAYWRREGPIINRLARLGVIYAERYIFM